MPLSCLTKSRWNQQHWNYSGERHVTSEAWSMPTYRSLPKGQPLHQPNFLGQHPANNSESPKAPSTIFNLNYTVLYTTPRTQLYTQLYSTQLYSTTTLQPTIRYSVPSLRQGRHPHRSVGSTPRIHLPKVGGWYQDMIHLEIEESWKEKKRKNFTCPKVF